MAEEEKKPKFYLPEDITILPENVTADILSRLPVKTLLQFKCVCTKWRNLISSPYFASLHLSRSNSNPLRQSILVHISSPRENKFIPFDTLTFSPYTYFNVGLDQACSFGGQMRFVGSINGLLCLSGNSGKWVCLWNPSTRMFRKIKTKTDTKNLRSIGFGLDPIANDYKIVVVFNLRNEEGVMRTGVKVWSTNLESWRVIKVDSYFTPKSFICDVMVKEFAYWIVSDGLVSLIASFNMTTEVLQLVPVPDVYPMNNDTNMTTEVLQLVPVPDVYPKNNGACFGVIWKENFALATSDSSGAYQVWTMENDNVGEVNWSKKFTFQFGRSLQCCYSINVGNGKLLHNMGARELILYDLETRTRQTANTMKYNYSAGGAQYYVESLISIKGFKHMVENAKNMEQSSMFLH